MTLSSCASPLPVATLLEYWLGELDEARERELDQHLLGCGHCSANLQHLVEIGGAVRAAVRSGAVHGVLSDGFVKRLAAQGLQVREYRVPRNGSVNCTVAPDDDLLVARLEASLSGVERLDVEREGGEAHGVQRLSDVPFDAAAGEVVLASRIDWIRALPACTERMRLVAVEPSGERLLGEYTFLHTPWGSANRG